MDKAKSYSGATGVVEEVEVKAMRSIKILLRFWLFPASFKLSADYLTTLQNLQKNNEILLRMRVKH